MKMNLRKTFYLMTLTALALVAAVGLLLVPGVNTSGTVSAQDGVAGTRGEVATPEMIAYALTKSEDLSVKYNYINQLPCQELSGDLSGKTVAPGVYCVASANLTSELILDGQNDESSMFIFRVAGAITAKGASVSLINEAQAARAIFVAESATLSDGTDFNGNIFANKSINIEDGSILKGRTESVSGDVVAAENAVVGGTTGTIEICKAIDPSSVDISNRVFQFSITGVAGVIEVPVGSCSSPIDVPVPMGGVVTITEGNGGRTITGGNFQGNFALVRVETISANSTSSVGTVNLPARTVSVNIRAGGVPEQLSVRFVNRFAITGFVEICKAAATGPTTTTPTVVNNPTGDPDVTGFFQFTIENVFQQPNSTELQVFTAPVGGCTRPIAVTIFDPSPTTTTTPRESTVRVTELGRPGFFLESVDTVPTDREVGMEVLGSGVNAQRQVVPNPGGGFATVRVVEGGPAIETVVNFRNRSNPGQFKVCKIAGPGVPEFTTFRFTVEGFGATTAAEPQFAVNGDRVIPVDVVARPSTATSPNGGCTIVPGFGAGANGTRSEFQTFVNGTVVTVTENGISPANTISQPGGQLRTSRIRPLQGTVFASTAAAGFSPNPDLTPNAAEGRISRGAVIQRASFTEIEFTNFRFNPTLLKVCKVGLGTVDTTDEDGDPADTFTFDVALTSPTSADGTPIFPTSTVPVTVTAGPDGGPTGDRGFCTFANGATFPGGGFNQGSTITITERAATGSTLTAIDSVTSSPTPAGPLPGGGLNVDLPNRRATLLGTNGLVAGTTIVTFTNTGGTVDPEGAVAFDFDGDRKSDVSIYRGGTWWYAASSANGQQRATTFGLATDKIVPADFDGDGKTDNAVYRGGIWHILGSRDGYTGIQFGVAEDIPQPGDFDGDGKADVAVFRPSNGVWYMMGSRDGFSAVQFGQNGDIPVAADFDGDNKMDQAVYRNGTWFMLRSRDGFAAPAFGLATDVPVVADYDGDGKADTAVYRGGTWYMLRSTEGFRSVQLGISTDQPVPADYDGDGKADAAVYRGGVWYMIRSGQSGEADSVQFGLSSDMPVPASFLRR